MAVVTRRNAAAGLKREVVLRAARQVFEAEGLDGASLQAIAAAAGYTPAALCFHFPSKELIYAEVLRDSLAQLRAAVDRATAGVEAPAGRLRSASMAFFGFYEAHPREMDLGFYLLRGGMRPRGLGRVQDEALNAALGQALAPIALAAVALGAQAGEAQLLVVDLFAHAAGLLLLAHTGRIRMFGAEAGPMMARYVEERVMLLGGR